MIRGRSLSLCVAFVPALLAPAGKAAAQTSQDSVIATVEPSRVAAIFRDPSPVEIPDNIHPTVPPPDVDAIFRTSVRVSVVTTGDGERPDAYDVVARDVNDPSRTVRQTVVAGAPVDVPLQPGDYTLSLNVPDSGCSISSMKAGSFMMGAFRNADFEVVCPTAPFVTLDVRGGRTNPRDPVTLRWGMEEERPLASGDLERLDALAAGENRLVLTLPDRLGMDPPPVAPIRVELSEDVSDTPMILVDGGAPQLIDPSRPAIFPFVDSVPMVLRLSLPEPAPRTSTVRVGLEGDAAAALPTGTARIRIEGGEDRPIRVGEPVEFDSVPAGPIRLVVSLDDTDVVKPSRHSWHLGAGLGAIAVSATDATSFTTPTVSLSLVRGDSLAPAPSLYLTGQLGYWRSGPSGPDPVVPDDPRPPFRNRTIWTWSVGASYFFGGWDWGGLGLSASWVEGRETASQEDKYMNRSRGVAVGPRLRVLTDSPWPSIILGLDVQYGEAEELRLDEPELRWSLTPVLSLNYVLF